MLIGCEMLDTIRMIEVVQHDPDTKRITVDRIPIFDLSKSLGWISFTHPYSMDVESRTMQIAQRIVYDD